MGPMGPMGPMDRCDISFVPCIPFVLFVLFVLLSRVRASSPMNKAILMSGYAAPGVIEAAVAAKEIRFLQKPFGTAELARMLREVLQHSGVSEHS